MVVQPHVIPVRKITIYSPITINLVEGSGAAMLDVTLPVSADDKF